MFLIYSSYALSLEKFGISGGRHGVIDAFMLNLLLHFGIALADPLQKNSFPQVAWAIGPSFILWNLFLGRNRHIFCNSSLGVTKIW